MMPNRWEDRWLITRPLSHGGQGTTSVVRSVSTGEDAVLKILRRQQDSEARRRMYQEVANLKVLFSAGAKVPRVLDDNTDAYDSAKPLFFVMENIPGTLLSDLVSSRRGLSLDDAIGIVKDLGNTIGVALAEGVIHRDLKPENIIVRDLDSHDVVILDYGLSFNQREPTETTRETETIDNHFLSLPERRVRGGNRRDPRSELTSLCAILSYALTAIPPVDLLDASGNPPHRRPGASISEKLQGDPRGIHLNALLDRGFATILDNRFQTVEELLERLALVQSPFAESTPEDPARVATETSERLLRHNRVAQLARYREYTHKASQDVIQYILEQQNRSAGDFGDFKIRHKSFNISQEQAPPDTEPLAAEFGLSVSYAHGNTHMFVYYSLRARGQQIGVFRARFQQDQVSRQASAIEWVPITWCPAVPELNTQLIKEDIRASIVQSIRELEALLLKS